MSHQALVTPFSSACQKGINEQIHAELSAAYVYHTLYAYFDRHDVALYHVARFFKKACHEEREHADKFLHYLNQRGGTVVFYDIKALELKSVTLLHAFEQALELEKQVHQKILALYQIATAENEFHFLDFLESEFLGEQVKAEDELVRLITNIKRVGIGLGEYLFDQHLKKE